MGSSSSSSKNHIEDYEQFHFRFTDCLCKCDASKKPLGDIYEKNHMPQTAFLTALMTQINRSQYDIRCDCDCGDGVKMGFLFGNTSSSNIQETMNDNSEK